MESMVLIDYLQARVLHQVNQGLALFQGLTVTKAA